MKVCLINNLYKPYLRGGAEKVVEILESDLKRRGHEVFVINSTPRFPLNFCWYGDLEKHGTIFRLFWHFFDVFNLHSYFAVRKILRKEKPDVIWTHNLKGLGYLIPRAIKSSKIKHVHTLHDVQLSVPSGLIIKGQEDSLEQKIFLRSWYEKICRWLFASPDTVISPSKWLMDFYTKKGFFSRSKRIVLPNPTSVAPVPCSLLPAEHGEQGTKIYVDPQAKLDGDSGVFNILYLGQIEEHKGILFAIRSLRNLAPPLLSSLSSGGAKWRLCIVGDGSRLEDVKNLVINDPRFIIYGRKEGEELEEIWKKINLTIVPSLCYENSPTVIFESFSRNIPVIASNIGGIGEVVSDEFLFEPRDERHFLEKIDWFIENKNKLSKIKTFQFGVENYINKILRQ